MYRKYVLKRVAYGIMMYIVMITIYSTLFNTIADTTQRSLIGEQVAQEMLRTRNLTEDAYKMVEAEKLKAKYEQYHLNDPLLSRIFWRTVSTVTLDYGNSTTIRSSGGDRRVITIISEVIPKTLILFTTDVILVIIIGTSMGLYAARKPNGFLDRAISTITMITNGLPSWWLGMLMIMVFAYAIPLFPSGGLRSNPPPEGFAGILDFLWHLSLPLFTLGILQIWGTAYITRNIVLSNLQEDFIMAARARGVSETKVLFGHTLRTSMPAIMTMAVMGLFGSIFGNIVVESIFGWPGVGNLYFIAIQVSDVPVLMGSLAISSFGTMLGFIILDIIYGLLDPRIKTGGVQA